MDVADWLWMATPAVRDAHVCDALWVQVLPLMAQDNYGRLLWYYDLNAVRGEDSSVHAQWAERPLLWHIYRQEEEAHLAKLETFLELYCAGLSIDSAENLRTFWLAWNADGGLARAREGPERQLSKWRKEAQRWAGEQGMHPDFAARLV